MKKFAVTISREYGSGGRLIGELAAEKLGIAFYNRNLIDLTAERSGFAKDYITKREEKISSRFIWPNPISLRGGGTVTGGNYYMNEDKMFITQSNIIKEVAQKESCVIVGRCADYVLQDFTDCINIFIRSDQPHKIARLVYEYGIEESKAKDTAVNTDKGRANYYSRYTNFKWGHTKYYNLVIDSGMFGIDGSVDLIVQAVKQRFEG